MALCVERALVSARLPARWQMLLQRLRSGVRSPHGIGCLPGEVAVIAKMRDTSHLRGSAEFRPGACLGRTLDGEGWLTTARVPLIRVETLLADPGILQLEPAHALRPLLDDATLELGALPEMLPVATAERLGAGSMIGVVDSACDWQSANFADHSGRPRIAVYWDQSAPARRDARADYGAIWDRAELWVADASEELRRDGTAHGTSLLEVAAGGGEGGAASGVAPRAEIAYVAMRSARPERAVRTPLLGDTVRMLEGAKFIFDVAGTTPCAVNVSLGVNSGPHDGTSLAEQSLDALALEGAGRGVVVAAGNGYAAEQHASATIDAREPFDLRWHAPGGRGRHAVEIWYSQHDRLELELIAPRGQGQCRVAIDENCVLVDEHAGRVRALIAHESRRAGNGDRVITIFVERGAPGGVWTARLTPRSVTDGRFHAWIEPEDDVRPVFTTAADPLGALNGLACGFATLAVGAFDARRPELPAAWYSAAGPTRDGRAKPDVCAPGHRVWASAPGRRESLSEYSGTSLAAAAGAGVLALVMAEAQAAGARFTAMEYNRMLRETARRCYPSCASDARYGGGRLDAAAAVERVHQAAPAANQACMSEATVAERTRTRLGKNGDRT